MAAVKVVKHSFRPASASLACELVNHSVAGRASVISGAVSIAGLVKHHTAFGILAVSASAKTVQNGFCPSSTRYRTKFEYRPVAIVGATSGSCSVKVAGCIPGQA